MKEFGSRFTQNMQVLDIGCGHKPYKKYFSCTYVGLDPVASINPDIIADAWDIPLPDHSFDGIVLNQSLEHIAEIEATIREIWRLLKPGGFVIVTVPHTVRDHSVSIPADKAPVHNFNYSDHPYWRADYYRFTKFGLIYLFRDFKTVSIVPTTGYIGSIFQLVSLFFASLGKQWLFAPIYALNNVLALIFDRIFFLTKHIPHPIFQKFYHFTYSSLPMNHIAIFQKQPQKH